MMEFIRSKSLDNSRPYSKYRSAIVTLSMLVSLLTLSACDATSEDNGDMSDTNSSGNDETVGLAWDDGDWDEENWQ